jgi:hypothetical protein
VINLPVSLPAQPMETLSWDTDSLSFVSLSRWLTQSHGMLNGPTNPLWVCDHYDAFLLTGKEGTIENNVTWDGKTIRIS